MDTFTLPFMMRRFNFGIPYHKLSIPLYSNIPSSPAYGFFILQLMLYARAWSSYECFILRARRLSNKLLKQGYIMERLKSSFRKFYGRYGVLIRGYEVSLSQMFEWVSEWVSEIGCLTSHATIFQLYMWRHIDVQADWRSLTYGRAPNAIDIP